jgi:hypothetical protein
MAGLYKKTDNLYGSLWGKATDDGLYDSMYSRGGASPQLKSYQQRLGELGQDQPARPIDLTAPPPPAPAAPTAEDPIWKKKFFGFPLWIYLIIVGTYIVVKKR